MNKLQFSFGNKKLSYDVAHISLPSGWSCPGAGGCLSKVCPLKGKLTQIGKRFRCYSASEEAAFPIVRLKRWFNFNLLKGKTMNEMYNLIEASLPRAFVVRLHVAGDFFSQAYFDAWLKVAKAHPQVLFYAYTKSLKFWVKRLKEIPQNFNLTASKGGKYDHLIKEFNLRYCEVVVSKAEAKRKGLRIDTDDSIVQAKGNFAVLLHGNGEKDSLQARLFAKKIRNCA